MFSELFNRLTAIRSFGNQRHVRLPGQKSGNAFPEQGVIVDRKNPNGWAIRAHTPLPSWCETTLAGDIPYAIEAGMLNSTSVPAPASLHMSSRAPIS
jgi:hypothetical protein